MEKMAKIVQKSSYPVFFPETRGLIIRDYRAVPLPAGEINSLHFHNLCEVGYCRCGEGLWLVGDSVEAIRPGDVMIVPPGIHHYSRSISRSCRCEFIYFDPDRLLESAGIKPERRLPPTMPAVIRDKKLTGILRDMIESSDTYEAALWFALFLAKFPRDLPMIRSDDGRLFPALRKIMLDYSLPITNADLASECGFCTSWFIKEFKREYHATPMEFLADFRVRVAAELLSGDLSVTEICTRAGFNSPSDLYRHFRKKFGISPSDYRKKQKARKQT